MNNYKLIERIIIAFCAAVYIACGSAHFAHAGSWDSVSLTENIPIDKITPSRDGVYLLSGRDITYWRFYDQAYSSIPIGIPGWVLDCELTLEGYLAVGYMTGYIDYFSGDTKLKDFGSDFFLGIDTGLKFMEIVVTGEHSLAFMYYEGAYRVTGEKYNHFEKMPWRGGYYFLCDGHNGTFWAAARENPEEPDSLFISHLKRIDLTTISPEIHLEGDFRGFYCDSNDTLWIATTNGLYWTPSDMQIGPEPGPFNPPQYMNDLVPNYPGPPPNSVVCDRTGRTIVGTDNDGLYLYDDGTWSHISVADGIADISIRCVGVNPDNRFYAAGTGWFSYEKESHVGVGEELRAAPFIVHSPYPNPANSAVTIGYTLDHDASVNIALYNMLGQKVLKLSEKRMAAGFHQSTFTTNDLASGLYLIHIDANGYHSFKKVTIIK